MLYLRRFQALIATGFFTALALTLAVTHAYAVEVKRVVSDTGIEAWLVEDHTVPIVALNFSFEGGSAQDPKGKEGLTRLLAAMLDEGADDLDSEAFQGRLEELAISIGFSTGKDYFYGSLRTLKPTLSEAADLLQKAIHKPRFDKRPLERMQTQLLTQIKRSETSPNAVAGRALTTEIFGDHPYARPTNGRLTTLPKLNAADLSEHRQKLFQRKRFKIGVVGAVDAETVSKLIDKIFADLPEASPLTIVNDIEPVHGKRLAKELDVPQTTVVFSLPGLQRNDPDYQAAFVMNHILGGGSFTSWLYKEVREKRGLSYSVGSSLTPYNHSALIVGSASTQNARVDETIETMLAQIERMATIGPTEDEVHAAKQYLMGSYGLRFDSSGKIARQLVGLQNAKLGVDYFDLRNAEIEKVSLDDVRRVAKQLLNDKQPTIVTVGPLPTPTTD